MTEIRLKTDGSNGVFALRNFCAGELITTYGVLMRQTEVPSTDMFIFQDDSYVIGNPNLNTNEHAQFICDAAQCSVQLNDGDTIYDISLKDILLIAEYLGKSITLQNVCRENLDFYACENINRGDELHVSYGTTYWLKNDLIDACMQALTECQYNDELCLAQDIADTKIKVVNVHQIEKRIILDFIDMLISGEYREYYKTE